MSEKNLKDKLHSKVKEFPVQSGVYLMKNSLDKIIYVGKAKNLRNRIRSYFQDPDKLTPKTRVLVRPGYPYRHTHSVYPVPYRFDYPGPNAKRECVARYVEEHRPSGTVVTPRTRCWWVRG